MKTARDTINRGTVPRWFRKRLIRAFGPDPHSQAGAAALDHAALSITCDLGADRFRWLDHWGTDTAGSLAFVSEPYAGSFNALARRAAERLAEATGCELIIDPAGTWNAGTIRLTWLPTGNAPPYAECRKCGAHLNRSQERRQVVRCLRQGISHPDARAAMPRCQTCTTKYLAERRASR